MTMHELVPVSSLRPADAIKLVLYSGALFALYTITSAVYTAYFGPLRGFSGPHLRKLSNLPELLTLARGADGQDYVDLHAKYGPVVRIGPNKLSYSAGAQSWKQIYGFRKQGQPSVAKDKFFYGKPFNNVDGVITADDANHSRQRKVLSHAFADKSLKDLEPMLKHWVSKMKTKLEEKAVANENVDILKYYNCTTFDIMGDLSFNEDLGMLENGEYSSWVQSIFLGIKHGARLRALKLINRGTEWFVNRFLLQNQRVRVKQAQHWNYSKERVDRRLARSPDRPDLWTKILAKSEGPHGLAAEEHYSTASLFMLAGTETTATALSGTTYYLLQNPDYLQRLIQEIRAAHHSFEDISLDSLQHLKYLHAVLQEGLRMYPPVPVLLPRVAPPGGLEICGEWVPEGTSFGVHQLSTYRSAENFKDPDKFRPERWLGDPRYKNDHLDAMEPFSVGPRNCLGKNLAWHEMRLILATTLYSFDMRLCEESNRWNDQKVYVLWEKKPLMCRLSIAESSM